MSLRLNLKPNERIIIGGAVIRNGASRAEILVENEVAVLREGDILGPHAVRTACERLYMALQLAYVDPPTASTHLETFRILATDVRAAAPSLNPLLDEIETLASAGRLYQALKKAHVLRHREKELISNVS